MEESEAVTLRADDIEVPAVKGGFMPTEAQQRYLALHLNPKTANKIESAIRDAGLSEKQIQGWFEDDAYASWFHNAVVRYMQFDLHQIYQALRKQAVRGRVPAIKLYLERFDKDYQAFLGKIDLSVRSSAAPVSNEEVVKALVKQLKTDPEFKEQLQIELQLEGETLGNQES